MAYKDLNIVEVDALQHLKIHLDKKKAEWEIAEVNDYPKAFLTHINPPCIDIVLTSVETNQKSLGANPIFEHRLQFDIWYFDQTMSANSKYDRVTKKLGEIKNYLIENPKPDNYGDFLITEGETSFRIDLGAVIGAEQEFIGGCLSCILKVHQQY